jgi:hypothetical protein
MEITESTTSAAIEHAMRLTGDDTLVLPLLSTPPGTEAAHAVLGRLLGADPAPLIKGSPLLAYVSGSEVSPTWRNACPPRSYSLWALRETLVEFYGQPPTGRDPYSQLEWLRHKEDADLET